MATKPGKTPLGQVHLNGSDFEVIPFKDFYGRDCIVEQDSLALYTPPGSSALWIGRIDPLEVQGTQGKARVERLMLLDLKAVKALVATLEMWIDRCTFDENYKPGERVKLP